MEQLRKLLSISSWQEVLATTDVWGPRFLLVALFLLAFGCAAQPPTEETNLQAGLAAQGQQEYWRAETFFQQAALNAPDDYQPSLDLARLHLLEHLDDLAQSELETARSLKSDNADIWLTLGDVAQDQHNAQAAEKAWLQAIHFNPVGAQTQARERLGLLYEQQSRWQDAEKQFAALPSDALAQYHLGALRLEQNDRTGARQAFQAVLNLPNSADQRDAAQNFLHALDQWNGSAQSQKLIGYTYIQSNLPALATASLKQATALAPQDAAAHAYLGWVYLAGGNTSQAQQEEQMAVALEPTNSFANYVLSVLDISSGRFSLADTALQEALTKDTHNPVLWATRGAIAEQLNDLVSAERDLRQAVDDAGGDPQFSLLLATFYANYQVGLNNDTALSAAQEAVQLNPTTGTAYDVLGRIQEEMKDFPDAISAYMQAVNFAPTNAAIHMHLGNILANQGYIRTAELNLRKAIVLDLNGPTARQAQQLLQELPALGV